MNETPQMPSTPEGETALPKSETHGAGPALDEAIDSVTASHVSLPTLDTAQGVKAEADAQDLNLKMIMDIPVDVHVEIGQTRLSIRDILRLGAGSVVELDRLAGQPADIVVNGKMVGQGDVVVVNETFGIRITKLVGVQERIRSL